MLDKQFKQKVCFLLQPKPKKCFLETEAAQGIFRELFQGGNDFETDVGITVDSRFPLWAKYMSATDRVFLT